MAYFNEIYMKPRLGKICRFRFKTVDTFMTGKGICIGYVSDIMSRIQVTESPDYEKDKVIHVRHDHIQGQEKGKPYSKTHIKSYFVPLPVWVIECLKRESTRLNVKPNALVIKALFETYGFAPDPEFLEREDESK
jgi:hypothetical protein